MRYIITTTNLPNDGVYSMFTIGPEAAALWLQEGNYISAIWHEGTAEVVSRLLGIKIPINICKVEFNLNDEALVLNLNEQLSRDIVLSADE